MYHKAINNNIVKNILLMLSVTELMVLFLAQRPFLSPKNEHQAMVWNAH